MRLEDLLNHDILERPDGNKRNIDDGVYEGITTYAEFQERESQYSDDGTRVVLSIKLEVENADGELVDLYMSPNYSWSKRGNMMKVLENLNMLPEPGGRINLSDLVGIPVQVKVENVQKDEETYSNVVDIKRIGGNRVEFMRSSNKKGIKKNLLPKTNPPSLEGKPKPIDEYEEVDSIDDLD